MARNVVDELVVRVTADAKGLKASLETAEKGARESGNKIGASFASAFAKAATLGAGAATAIGGVVTALTVAADKAADYADRIDKASQSTGFARGSFQELTFALDQNGIGFEQATMGLKDFNARLGQAASGNKSVADAYVRLGVAVRDSNGQVRDSESVFNDALAALSGLDSASAQAAEGALLFGEEFSRGLIPALNSGAEGIDALREKARELGIVLDDQSIGSLVRYKDEMAAFRESFGAASREITLQFLPLMTEGVLPAVENALRVFRNLPEPVQRGASALIGFGSAATAAATGLRLLGVSSSFLFGPAGLAFAAVSIIGTLAFAIAGGQNSLADAAEDGADALASGDAGSLTSAIDEVAGELDGELKEKLVAAQEELAETGRIGVAAAQDIERAFATVLARQGISRGILGAFPTSAATGLDLAGNASLLGAAAVPGVGGDVTARLAVGDLEGALTLVNQALDALTSNFTIIDRGVLAGLASFRDELAAGVRAVAEAEAFVPTPTPNPGNNAPDGSADDPFFVNPYGTPFGNQRAPLTGSASFQRGTASPANPDTAFVQSVLDADRDLNTFQTTLENLARAGREVTRDISNPGVSVAVGAPIGVRPEVSAVVDYGRTVARSGQELERLFAGSRILQSVETRQRVEELAATAAAEATAAVNDFTVSLDELARRGRAQSQANAVVAAREADPFAGVPGVNPGRQFQMDRRAGGAAVPIVFDVGAVADATNERVVEALDLEAEALAFKKNVVSAGVQFASDLAGAIKSGSPSGIFGALTGGIGSLVGISNPFAGGLISIIGGLFGGLLPDGRDSSEAARAAGATPGGAPAIELNLSVFQNLAVQSLTGGDRAAVDGLLDDTVRRIESVLVSFSKRLTAVETRTA